LDKAVCCHFLAFFYASVASLARWLHKDSAGRYFFGSSPGEGNFERTSPERIHRTAAVAVSDVSLALCFPFVRQ
jgi:hypothetical protein